MSSAATATAVDELLVDAPRGATDEEEEGCLESPPEAPLTPPWPALACLDGLR